MTIANMKDQAADAVYVSVLAIQKTPASGLNDCLQCPIHLQE